ncbi:hypothetical protein RJT34_03369 [Clitoria ternatea]|uniref:Uncharacterized protein n=1 Tax=Clitoria ternatea TaxID=43366 RepID=A0AAN9Q2G7_CLITE
MKGSTQYSELRSRRFHKLLFFIRSLPHRYLKQTSDFNFQQQPQLLFFSFCQILLPSGSRACLQQLSLLLIQRIRATCELVKNK